MQLTCEPARVLCLQYLTAQPFCNITNSREWGTPTNKNIARVRNARHKFELVFHRSGSRTSERGPNAGDVRGSRETCVADRARRLCAGVIRPPGSRPASAAGRSSPLCPSSPLPPRRPPRPHRYLATSARARKQPTYPRTRLIMY